MEKDLKLRKISLKNVITKDGFEDIEVEVIPFNYRNDDHVNFAFDFSDMISRMPSAFSSTTDASKAYVSLFMVHKHEDLKDENSNFYKVLNDKRASRTLLNQVEFSEELHRFFENA